MDCLVKVQVLFRLIELDQPISYSTPVFNIPSILNNRLIFLHEAPVHWQRVD